MNAKHAALELFADRFVGAPDFVVRAPGRVNLIGEHTDYNEGFVLPMAIQQATWLAFRGREDSLVRVASVDHDGVDFDLSHLSRGDDGWAEYVKGTAHQLDLDSLGGWEGAFATDIPIGAGLSSSAALEVATALAFSTLSGARWDGVAAALAARRVENEWMGLGSGIMDPLVIATAHEGHSMLIDCRTLRLTPVEVPHGISVVVLDTGTRRSLLGSEYDDRRSACERVSHAAGVAALRDLTLVDLAALAGRCSLDDLRRARHVISENERTLCAASALDAGDIAAMGRLLREAHESIRDDFDASSDELDLIVEMAVSHEACIGARMTGGGFGGCAVAMVVEEGAPGFVETVMRSYIEATGHDSRAYVTKAAPGATVSAWRR